MKTLAMMQPTFMPWLGYFALIDQAHTFVFLDDFQFVRRSFHQRNRLFVGPQNPQWISLPIAHPGTQEISIDQARLDLQSFRLEVFLKKIRLSYGKSPWWELGEQILLRGLKPEHSLAEVNMEIILGMCEALGIESHFQKSSDLAKEGSRSAKIISLLKQLDSHRYLAARGSKAYMDEDHFGEYFKGEVLFQNFSCIKYTQKHSQEFEPFLSVFDALWQVGPEATLDLIRQGSQFEP